MCEYTPREMIMAAGGVPVCLCGGSAEMVRSAETVLPANLCPLIKSTYGYSLEEACGFLEMADLVVAETTCDGKKKMYELLAERHPLYVLELPQKPKEAAALEHWLAEIRKLKSYLEDTFGVKITDERLREAIRVMNADRLLKRRLAALMADPAPPLTGRELLNMRSLISGIPEDLEQYEEALRKLPGRKKNRPDKSLIRVMLTGVPLPRGAERVMDIIESSGGLVVCQENCTGIKPAVEDVAEDAADPLRALAEKYFHLPCSVMTPNDARMVRLRELAGVYRPQCVIELVWQSCITYDLESAFVRRFAEDELGVPYLKIETDYSPSDSVRIGMRVQALFETIKERAMRV
jgi:benzoyl-CoA reductase/2-hydroxyglutaryl-CoA dehydratase subunit BcrC/BadD/HgdB